MAIFRLVKWNLVSKSFDGGKRGVSMVVVMKRKITSEMMTTYFPTLLLTAITFATTFFKPIFFEAALSVNLTTMLVMTTIFISKMEGLPPTSDIKMIDIWLVLCQIYPFAEVILLTAMEYNREDKKKNRKKKKGKKTKKGNKTNNLQIAPLMGTLVNENMGFDKNKKERFRLKCSLPSLNTIGEKLQMLILQLLIFDIESLSLRSIIENCVYLFKTNYATIMNILFRKKSFAIRGVSQFHRLLCLCTEVLFRL